MKITFILPGYCLKPIGGAKVVYQYANQLVIRGHEVSIIHPRFMRKIESERNRFLTQAARLFKIFYRPKKRAWQIIDDRIQMSYVSEPTSENVPDADVVFATAWQTAEYVREYPSSKGKRFYLIQHYETWAGPEGRVNATWKGPFKNIVIAKWLFNKGLELGISKDQMVYVPNGIDHAVFRIIDPIEMRPDRIVMMYHQAEWKGSNDGIKALEMLHEKHPTMKALLFSAVNRPASLPDWIEYRHSPSQKELVEEIYNDASIYLCPSWTEGAPAPPAEAMACGCALVSTNCTGIDEYAEHGITALLSPIKDPAALADNIMKLLDDDNLRVKSARAGNERIKEFTWEHSTDLLEEAVKQ